MWQIGIVVPDKAAAMESLGTALGLGWAHTNREIDILHGDVPVTIDLSYAIARQGPVHLELIEGQDGSPWWPAHGLDHVAWWASDLAATAGRMESAGFRREVTYQGDVIPLGFTYHRAPCGMRIEHVDAARRSAMLGWLQGTDEHPGATATGNGNGARGFETVDDYSPFGPAAGRPFHVAQCVTDLDAAMEELTAGLGIEWHKVQERTMPLLTPAGTVNASVRFTYSVGEPHIELLQGEPGTIWGPEHAGLHHIGLWTDDLAADSAYLRELGFEQEVTLAARDDGAPAGFTYMGSMMGIRLELVSTASRPAFERWFAGGEFE